MKRQIQVRTFTHLNNAQIIEHTPILDLETFLKRQKQIRRSKFLKNLYEGSAFICMVAFTFSFLFLGK
ncbi:hypothetical protein EXD93_05080 [Acinetobacter pittii]|nr:hypothetical protein EXD93_05080 [Acinetobacter pittii]